MLGSTGNLIGGTNGADRNVISGNAGAGVFIQNAGGNTVLGNYIGTTMLGTVSLGNGNNGISVYTSSQNTIGGVSSSARNVLAGNAGSGLYLQAGSSSNVIQGNYIGADVTGAAAMANAGDGITLQGSVNNLIGGTNNGAGNIISGNTKAGISFFGEAPDNLVQGNRIGTSASGSAALGNGLDGITLTNSPGNLIGGTTVAARNLISGNHQNGILILNGSFGTIIQGNFIGTSADGTNALANTQNGLNIETWDNTVGGTTSAARNLISGNGLDGIFIIGLGTTNNSVQGNYLGTRLNGASALHNGRAGLGVSSNAFYNLIGGTASGAGNLISGNFDAGLYLIGTSGNLVQGNIIGADASGTVAIPNAIEGMYVQYAVTNLIGGTVAGARNLISGNSTSGMFLTNSSWNTIQGNYIGTAADGVSPLGNGNTALGFNTLDLQPDSHNNVIGGAQPGAGNIIAYAPFLNTIHYAGVRIRNGCSNNLVSANSIFANQGLPIDLGTFGVSPNDHCDADGGATQGNQGQNFPVLSQAVAANGMVIRGTLDSTASSTFVLQFFGNPACTAWTNYGQAQFYLGQVAVTTSNDCTTSFSAQVSGTVPPGYVVTATATDSRNNTSESSACVSVGAAPPLNISPPSSHQITVYWTTNFAAGFVLQRTGDLTPPAQWSNVSNVPATNAGNYSVTLAVGPTNQFYRLAFQ